jgi:hypothetical protein
MGAACLSYPNQFKIYFIVSNLIAVSQLSSSYAQWRKESTIILLNWIHILKAHQNIGMLFD